LDIKKDSGVASIVPIYNHGAESGASISHPHAQIFASGIIANTVGREMDGADRYFGINGACVFCDIIKHEQKQKVRVVYENKHFLVATVFAARFPFETWIYPKNHESQFEETSKESMRDFADALGEILERLDKTLENPPINLYIHTLPTILSDSASFHWHLEIVPRVSNFGGFELGSDVTIDVMSPEEAGDYLRKSGKEDKK
jgi:UDPglucose--hexose-1-phosphate uridylyltransferase